MYGHNAFKDSLLSTTASGQTLPMLENGQSSELLVSKCSRIMKNIHAKVQVDN